jgi:ribosomal protein L7/L12
MTTPLQKAVDVFDAQAFDAHRVLAVMAEKFPVEFLKLAVKYPGVTLQKVTPVTHAIRNEVHAHLLSGDKVKAIKLIRAEHDLGLKEAKDVVDKIQEHLFKLTLPQIMEVKIQLNEGRYVFAIKNVRQATGLGLREAKAVVDRIQASMPTQPFN